MQEFMHWATSLCIDVRRGAQEDMLVTCWEVNDQQDTDLGRRHPPSFTFWYKSCALSMYDL